MAEKLTPQKKTSVTLQTIADELGISRTTVSNAFNRPDQMSPKLLKKIKVSAERLGYQGPNPAASVLRRGKSGTIAILFTESLAYAMSDPAALLMLRGVAEATEKAATRLLLLPAPANRETAIAGIREAVCDGFLAWTLPSGDPMLKALLDRRLPTITIDEPQTPGAGFVGADDRSGSRALAEHLIALGHYSFGVITWPLREDNFEGFADLDRQRGAAYPVAEDRLAGYADAFATAGILWGEVPVYECPLNAPEMGARAAAALLARDPRPTAIICLSDILALAAIDVATGQGIRVPDDLSIGGFDDIPAAASATLPLTTVRQPLKEKGELAATMLMTGWVGDPPVVRMPTELVLRQTTSWVPV